MMSRKIPKWLKVFIFVICILAAIPTLIVTGLLTLFLLLSLAGVLNVGSFHLGSSSDKAQLTQIPTQNSDPFVVSGPLPPLAQASSDSTFSSWQTIIDTKYKFTLKYPSNYTLQGETISETPEPKWNTTFAKFLTFYPTSEYLPNCFLTIQGANAESFSIKKDSKTWSENINLNGIHALRTHNLGYLGNTPYENVYINQSDFQFIFQYSDLTRRIECEEIISTFKRT